MLFAVQPLLLPPPPIDRMLIDTPQTLAAMLIGIWALIGMFALSIFRSSARLLSTFDRLTLTSDGTLETPEATAEPALLTPSAADEAVLHADNGSSARSAAEAITLCITGPSVRARPTRAHADCFSGRSAQSRLKEGLDSIHFVRQVLQTSLTASHHGSINQIAGSLFRCLRSYLHVHRVRTVQNHFSVFSGNRGCLVEELVFHHRAGTRRADVPFQRPFSTHCGHATARSDGEPIMRSVALIVGIAA